MPYEITERARQRLNPCPKRRGMCVCVCVHVWVRGGGWCVGGCNACIQTYICISIHTYAYRRHVVNHYANRGGVDFILCLGDDKLEQNMFETLDLYQREAQYRIYQGKEQQVLCVLMCVCVYVCMYVCLSVCMYVYVCVCVYACTYI